ncbi:hypothetical protein CRM22_001461, partial [Opisthorchis felineus]
IPDNRGHLTCPHFGSYPSRTTELDRIFRVANHSVTDATFWEPLRPSEASATLPSSVGRNSSTPENSGVWHQAFSPTTFATLASVLCRRRDCIEMNWDTDEDEDEEEESRAGDIVRPNENRANINLINSNDHAHVTASEAVSRPLSEIWNGKQTTHPIVVHKNDSSVSRIQTYMSPIPPSNVSLLQSVVPEVPSPKLWPLPPEPVVDELPGSDTLQGREKPQDRQSVVGCQTDFVDHLRAAKLQMSSVGDRSLPQPSYIHSKATGALVVQPVTSTTVTSLPCWNAPAAGDRQLDFELPSLDLTQPMELLASTVRPISSRTFFSGLGVPTIVEEEEEVSVDYDTSLMTSSMHRPASEYLDGAPVATVHHPTQETPEEDYPLLRPDYLVNVDRSEHSSSGTTTKNNREFSPNLGENVEILRDSFVACPSLLQHTTDESAHRSSIPRGLPLPAVLRWLESTQTANEQRTAQSESLTGTNVINSTAAHVSGNIPVLSGPTFSDRTTKQDPRTISEEVRITRTTNPDTVLVRLRNTRRGENLGIQIKPVFVDSAKLSRETNIQSNTTDRVESGLEVHHIMPHGRVAKEGCLSVGDRILSINGISLAGMPFEKGRDMFQAALSQPELVLEVLPRPAPGNTTGQVEPPCEKPEKLCCRLIVIDDQSAKAKEAEAQGKPRSDKPAPPPPPRRSPNTMLTRFPAGVIPSLIDEYFQEKTQCETDRHVTVTEPRATATDHTPTLPPKSSACYKPTAPPMEECIEIYLQKGSNGLGFSLTSRDHPVLKERVVCVKSILPGGAALLDGRLHPGDRLVQVDGHDVAILGQARAVHLLREKPVNSIVKLLVWREPTATVSCGPDVVAFPTASNKSLTKDAAIPAAPSSTKKVENLTDYRIHSINPAHFKIFDLHIPLPQTPTNPPMENPSASSPVTLGVSVSVRPSLPPHVPLQASHREPDNSENAVFVRTVIEGGAAHSDGRLQVGDRLLSIDGIPLSGISGADALTRMKTVIARNLAEKRPSVRLLIARLRVEPETSSEHEQRERIGDESMASATNTVSVETHSTGHVHNMPKHTQSMTHLSNVPPIPVKTSMVVAAEVHSSDGMQNSQPNQPPTLSYSRKEPPLIPGRRNPQQELIQSTGTTPTPFVQKSSPRRQPKSTLSSARDELSNRNKSKHHHTHRQCRKPSHSARSSRRKERKPVYPIPGNAVAATLPKYKFSNVPTEDSTGFRAAASDSSPPTLRRHPYTDNQVIPPFSASSPLIPSAKVRGFRKNHSASSCQHDSEETISSTDLNEDHNAGKPFRFALPKYHSSDTDLNGSSTAFSDPETERHSSAFRHPNHRRQVCTIVGPRYRYRENHPTCRVIIQQPRIDLSQMVLVPFDPDAWNGPVLKPRSSLKPEELTQISLDHQSSQCQYPAQIALMDVTSDSRQSTPASRATAATHSAISKMSALSYDSDGGTSRKTSQSSGTDMSVKQTHRRLIGRILKLVKSGRHRRFSHNELSVSTQTDPPMVQQPGPPDPAAMRTKPGLVNKLYVASQTNPCSLGDEQAVAIAHQPADSYLLTSVPKTRTALSSQAPISSGSHVTCTAFNTMSRNPSVLQNPNSFSHHQTEWQAQDHVYSTAKSEPNEVHGAPASMSGLSRTVPSLPTVFRGKDDQTGRPNHPYADLSFHQPAVGITNRPGSCAKGVQTTFVFPTVNLAQSSINRLFDTDASSCSTAYESVQEVGL